jgi:glycosyltransferase involved in cell wall biosynthesis
MKIAVIIPVYNSSAMLSETLRAIRGGERVPDEIIVVDDGSIDDSGAVATSFGATVIALSANFGPATCRNHAALRARSDVLVFLDADTCVHGDTLKRMESHLELDSELGAVIGSYDDEPRDPGLCSQFRNLAHCYVHHSSKRAALTFWSGCGAVRRNLFLEVDGFDQRYRRPSIEDIELGYRLSDRGIRILLDPAICVTHTKRWTVWNSIVTDVTDRVIPWMVLLLERGKAPNDLNIRRRHRIATVLSAAGLFCLVATLHSCSLPSAWTQGSYGLFIENAVSDYSA